MQNSSRSKERGQKTCQFTSSGSVLNFVLNHPCSFRFIQRIIDVWSLEATDSSAMTHAAKAVYKAQDRMHEIQPDYPFSNSEQPDTTSSSFPRSLFGKARAAVNGALAVPSAAEALQLAASDDVRSSVSAVERTESGVSAAESVESFSSARSNASGGNVAIALVASGNKNGYEGGLHHVVIPETEAVAGPPPPEKLGAPLVEGRFLPNMHPHSHILQQPHIRAVRDSHNLTSDLQPTAIAWFRLGGRGFLTHEQYLLGFCQGAPVSTGHRSFTQLSSNAFSILFCPRRFLAYNLTSGIRNKECK
jgi:hypothetical protein